MRRAPILFFALSLASCAAELGGDVGRSAGDGRLRVSADTLMGVHFAGDTDEEARDLAAMMDARRGFTTEVVYAENPDWAPGQAAALRRLRERGLTVILRIDWARGQSFPPPGREEDYARYVRDVLLPHVGDAATILVVGNEPNLDLECAHVGGRCEPEQLAGAYRRARDVVRAAYPDAGYAFLLGGVSPGGVWGPRYADGNDFLRRMLRAIPASELDGIAIHSYGGGDAATALRDFQAGVTGQLAVARETGHGGAPVFITEMNRETRGGDDDARVTGDFLRRAYAWLDAHNRGGAQDVVGACWFVYANDPAWSTYALRAHRPVWEAFRDAARAGYHPGELASAPPPPPPGAPCDPPHTVLAGDRCVPSCGRAGGDTCGGAGSHVCDGHALLEAYDCAVCCSSASAAPPPPPPSTDCACASGVDNVCFLPSATCSATRPGGYCDPNGDGDYGDGDWVRGWYAYRERCGEAPAPPPPPPPAPCPCVPGGDNFCQHGPSTSGCAMTAPGGYCDPDGDGSYDDADWGRGWTEHRARCS